MNSDEIENQNFDIQYTVRGFNDIGFGEKLLEYWKSVVDV